ncbi:hypothetical protein Tco_0393358 [Tanacetum coccineum]
MLKLRKVKSGKRLTLSQGMRCDDITRKGGKNHECLEDQLKEDLGKIVHWKGYISALEGFRKTSALEGSFRPAFNLLKGTCKSFVELVVPADYFFNNDLEYLKGGISSRKYTTSTTKTKATRYDNIEGIEDMVLELWSPVKHDVISKKRIIAVTYVKVMKWYGYGYLEEIIIRREDQSLHKFKEGEFPRLNLRDIEDLLFLLVQKKLSNLDQDVIFDLENVHQMHCIIYQDKFKRNRLMRFDELYKFCDCTLTSVRRVLHDIANNLRMDYLPKRKWSNLDRTRSRIMIKAIDQQLFERRLMRNLEKFVGGREYRNDFRLLEWTI